MLAAALAAAFAGVVAGRWLRSHRPAFAAWAVGLAIFSAAAAVQAAGEAAGFTPALFRAFYLLGGVLGVIYLALGTVFLLAPPRVGRVSAAVLVGLTLLLAVDAALVPVDPARLATPAGVLGRAIAQTGSPLVIAAVLFNIVGTVVLVGGSAFSAWGFIRRRQGVDRVLCNVLLTAGALVIALGFSVAKTAGGTLGQLSTAEAIGIAVMFLGFLSLGRVGHPAIGAVPLASEAAPPGR